MAKTTNALKTTNVASGVSHHRSLRRVLASIRALVGPVTPDAPDVPDALRCASVDAIATSAGAVLDPVLEVSLHTAAPM